MTSESEACTRRLAFQKSYSLEHGGSWRRRSLIDDAKFDTITNAEFDKIERESTSQQIISPQELGEEEQGEVTDEVFTVVNGDASQVMHQACSLVLTIRDATSVSRIFKHFENSRASVGHIETRKGQSKHKEMLVQFEVPRDNVAVLVKSLSQHSGIQDVRLLSEKEVPRDSGVLIPHHISDLDRCQHLLTKFDPDLDQSHPGYTDKGYRSRRSKIVEIAFNYKHGQPIPQVEYALEEIKTWGVVYRMLKSLYQSHACREHIETLQILERECGYSEHNIPQLEDVSNFLKKRSGFQLRPVGGLLSARDFLTSLAFRVFQCTQYIRHSSTPDHTVEPDCVHELLGHVPMLANPGFAQFSQDIGIASIGASDEDIEKFATIYWFTVEFGLCQQDGQVRAYGAGLLSAYGELKHALSDKPERKKFEPSVTALEGYDDQEYQKVYFVCESFEDMKERVRRYAAKIKRPNEIRYDPYTQTLQVMNNKKVIQDVTRVLEGEINTLTNVLNRIENFVVS